MTNIKGVTTLGSAWLFARQIRPEPTLQRIVDRREDYYMRQGPGTERPRSLAARSMRPATFQFGRLQMALTQAESALLVPQKAVTEMQSAKIVYVVGPENKVALRSVTLGPRAGQDYIVTEGVKAGESVIVEGMQKVCPGDIVDSTNHPVSNQAGFAQPES
jgi:hypothetical protein